MLEHRFILTKIIHVKQVEPDVQMFLFAPVAMLCRISDHILHYREYRLSSDHASRKTYIELPHGIQVCRWRSRKTFHPVQCVLIVIQSVEATETYEDLIINLFLWIRRSR